MIPVLSREQIRALDRHAIDHLRVPSLVLMENAGRGAAEVVERALARRPGPVTIVCGAGNNGGDGFVVARRLRSRGYEARVSLVANPERLSGDARVNHDAWVGTGGAVVSVTEAGLDRLDAELARATIVVDALLGTGLDRPVAGLLGDAIERINRAPGVRIALDIPSGLDANTGCPLGGAVRAHETVTFARMKLGLVTSIGAEHAGHVTVVDIGIPEPASEAVGESARVLESSDVAARLARRPLSLHKGAAGRVTVVAGSPGKTGAALLVARGALRGGAGLVTLCGSQETAEALDGRVLEEMTARIDPARPLPSLDEHLAGSDAVVVGPGLGLDRAAREIVDHVVLRHPGFVVVDADALTHLAGRLGELRGAAGKLVLTPHPGEMARLLATTSVDVEQDRFGAVARAVDASRSVVLLKGARTLIGGPSQSTVVNPSGSPALATAGSGDVLSGITAAMLAALHDPFHAACAAAYVHGAAGEAWSRAHGSADRGLLAHEIADGVPSVIADLTRERRSLPH